MSRLHKEHLQAGFIYGDPANGEYVYLPPGEVGTDQPLAVLENSKGRTDISLDQATHLIDKLTLKRCKHPSLGDKAF